LLSRFLGMAARSGALAQDENYIRVACQREMGQMPPK
jgi:hypothetical protein